MQITFNPKSLEYQGTLGNPQRLVIAHNFLKQHYKFIQPKTYIQEPTIHSKELINKVKSGNFFNPDSPAYENIFEYAMHSVNASIHAQKIQGFALIDPPGHHAHKNSLGGFCYFNNICEAVIQSELQTLIIDIDGHHGNGTEDIVKNNPDIFFISLHCSPCYPRTGLESYSNILNIPLPPDCGEQTYLKALTNAINKIPKSFQFKQIAISAGFDTYPGDLASLGLKKESYSKIAKIIKQLRNKTNSKLFCVWEGGYSKNIGELMHSFIQEL